MKNDIFNQLHEAVKGKNVLEIRLNHKNYERYVKRCGGRSGKEPCRFLFIGIPVREVKNLKGTEIEYIEVTTNYTIC